MCQGWSVLTVAQGRREDTVGMKASFILEASEFRNLKLTCRPVGKLLNIWSGKVKHQEVPQKKTRQSGRCVLKQERKCHRGKAEALL